MLTPEEWTLVVGVLGAVLTVVSNLMKRMVPLRIFAVFANGVFAVAGVLAHDRVVVVLQLALLAINGYRLWDLKRLIAAMAHAHAHAPLQDWLLPYMKRKRFPQGATLFRKGDAAHEMFYIREGTIRVVEHRQTLGPGNLVGEIGLFSEQRARTATLVCETDCVCYTLTDEAIYLLYYQNPRLGFLLVRTIVQRLLQDLQRGSAAPVATD